MRLIGVMLAMTLTTAATAKEGFFDRFDAIDARVWNIATHTTTHPWFDTQWMRESVQWGNGLSLRLAPASEGPKAFTGAALRRQATSHYGRYEAVMTPARGAGMITGFFIYTGPYYGDPHDEIDIEFLGKDTTKLHIAVFADGVLTNRFIDLGFDAADGPRLYAFEWREGSVRWFVGDRMVHEVRAADTPLPRTPGMMFTNIWAADPQIAGWSGRAAPDLAGESRFDCVAFAPYGADAPPARFTCADLLPGL